MDKLIASLPQWVVYYSHSCDIKVGIELGMVAGLLPFVIAAYVGVIFFLRIDNEWSALYVAAASWAISNTLRCLFGAVKSRLKLPEDGAELRTKDAFQIGLALAWTMAFLFYRIMFVISDSMIFYYAMKFYEVRYHVNIAVCVSVSAIWLGIDVLYNRTVFEEVAPVATAAVTVTTTTSPLPTQIPPV